MRFGSFNEAIDFAVDREEAANKFYLKLAAQMEHAAMKAVFEDFAAEEKLHKEKLLEIKNGKIELPTVEKVMDLKIGDYLVDVQPNPGIDYQQALVVAMKQEKAAFKMYMDIAGMVTDTNLQNTFFMLANEEAKHKLRFEVEYDDLIDEN
mgnify:FL=1